MNLRTALALFGVLAWTGLCVWGTWTVADTGGQKAPPDTAHVDRPMRMQDLVSATMPDQVTTYKAPDSSDTRKECFQIPTWLSQSSASTSTKSAKSKISDSLATADTSHSTQNSNAETPLKKSVGPAYAITPLTDGRPSLSVTSQKIELQGVLPTGAGRTWTYNIPQDNNRLSAYATAMTLPATPAVTSGLRYERRWHLGRMDLTAAPFAGVGVTSEGRGFAGGLELSVGLKW